MGLFTLLFALGSTINETIKENAANRRALEERRRYEDIDWGNIEYVTLDGTETAYRIEEEEEFDIVTTNFLSEMDGWPHYETKTVEHQVEDGENYCFTIRYKGGTEIYRKFHETSSLTERLLEYCNDNLHYFSPETIPLNCNPSTNSQLNAVIEAKNHLNVSSFSHAGLIHQLEFEDFSNEDAVYAADNCGADWNKQAIRSAKSYLIDCDGFSYSELINELQKFEKFTPEQAKYGVDNCGADWNEQAVICAKSYLIDCSGFSYSKLIYQLHKIENFTLEQAKYGVDNCGADWNEQAVKSAKSYLECFDYSRQELIEQLKNEEEFTNEQAEYAANNVGNKGSSAAIKSDQPNRRFAVIDFETTGLNYDFRRPPMDEIISVAIIDQDENVLLDTYCDTVKIKSWYEAQRIHGISPRDVKGYPTFVDIMPKVIEILSSYDYVIAYNTPFEKSFLENYAHLYTPTDFSIHKINWGEDPMEMFMNYMGSQRFLKLETAAEHFGYSYNAHDSLEDTKATLHVYKNLKNIN